MISWVMPTLLAVCLLLAGALNVLAVRMRNAPPRREPSQAPAETKRPASPEPLPTPIEAQRPKERIFVGPDITSQFLYKLFNETHTSMQGKKLIDLYVGKWMKLSGPVGNVGDFSCGSAEVIFSTKALNDGTVIMSFSEKWVERLSILRRGNDITVLGRIKKVDYLSVHLDQCELV